MKSFALISLVLLAGCTTTQKPVVTNQSEPSQRFFEEKIRTLELVIQETKAMDFEHYRRPDNKDTGKDFKSPKSLSDTYSEMWKEKFSFIRNPYFRDSVFAIPEGEEEAYIEYFIKKRQDLGLPEIK